MKNNLPEIGIDGVGKTPRQKFESLFPVETLLVWMGYDFPDERWNSFIFHPKNQIPKRKFGKNPSIFCNSEGDGKMKISYFSNETKEGNEKRFRADRLGKILNYIKLNACE